MYGRKSHPQTYLPKINKTTSPKKKPLANEDLLRMPYAEKARRLSELYKVFGLHSQAGQSLNKLFGNQYSKHGTNYPRLRQRDYHTSPTRKRRKMNKYAAKSVNVRKKLDYRNIGRRAYKEESEVTEELKDSQAMLSHLENQFSYIARTCKGQRKYRPYVNNFKDFRQNLRRSKKVLAESLRNGGKFFKARKKKSKRKKFKIDLVPRKKRKEEIMKDIEAIRQSMRLPPVRRGQDRETMITKLQKKNQFAEDEVNKRIHQLTDSQHKKIQMALDSSIHKVAKKWNYFYVPIPENYKEKERDINPNLPKTLAELDYLFDEVVGEIEERQDYLKSVVDLEMPSTKKRVKNEILERVAELERINKMIKEERKKLKKINTGKGRN